MRVQLLPSTFDSQGHATSEQRLTCFLIDECVAVDAGSLALALNTEQRAKVRLFRSFDPEAQRRGDLDMADPWYGDDGAFDQTYAEVVAAADGVVEHVRDELFRRAHPPE